jgi:hypothetical protein
MLSAQRSSSFWDWVGQGLSVLCIAHCMALPLVLSLVPAAAAEILEGESVHGVLLALIVGTAAGAFWLGFRQHQRLSSALFDMLVRAGSPEFKKISAAVR